MGSFISRTIPFYFGLFFLFKKNLKKFEYFLFYSSLLSAVISIFFSGERLALFFLILFFLIFNALIILSSVLSDYKLESLKNTLFYSRYILFSVVIAYFCFCNDKLVKLIFYCFAVVYFLIFFGALIELIFNYNVVYGFKEGMIIGKDNLPTEHAYEEYKISSLFGDEWVMGSGWLWVNGR